MKLLLRSRNSFLLVGAVGLLVLALALAAFTMQRSIEAIGWVNHTHEVIAQVSQIVSTVKDAETEQRGYIITGADTYLEAFEETVDSIEERIDQLAVLVAGNQRQTQRVEELHELVLERIVELREGGRIGGERGIEAVREYVATSSALRLMLGMRTIEREMIAEENALLESRQARMQRELTLVGITTSVSGALALGMGLYAYFVVLRSYRSLQREAELLRAKEKAEKADREKSEFLANMSHEIRTPLNAVLGFADLLRAVSSTPKQRRYVEAISGSGQALLSLINDILDLSKIEAGKLDVTLRPISVRELMENLRMIFSQHAEQLGLKLDFVVEDSVPPVIVFAQVRFRQILVNLVGNALKFTSKGGVTVTTRAELSPDDETRITLIVAVADTGIGISQQDQERMFEPFRQVGKEWQQRGSGTGLGLTITRRLIEMLGGTISVSSTPGEGSVFTVRFAHVAISSQDPDQDGHGLQEVEFNHLRASLLLLVDDVALNHELVAGYIESTHHRLIHARTGREGVAMAGKHAPDVILMDIRMPDLDGRDALEEIRRVPELVHIPVIAVTASSMVEEERRLRELFDGYIRKPFSQKALYDELARVLPPDGSEGTHDSAEAGDEEMLDADMLDDHVSDHEAWATMLVQLRKWETETVPNLARSMGMREMEGFATKVINAGERAGCGPVRTYGGKLLREVREINLAAQDQLLAAFPKLVARITNLLESDSSR